MNSITRSRMLKLVPAWIAIGLAVLAGLILFLGAPLPASAHLGTTVVSTCGKAVIDGNVGTAEWSGAATTSFQTVTAAPVPFNATLYVMNTRNSLYIGITIADDEFSTVGTYLPSGDGFRIDFDNDHSGTLEAMNDDVLMINAGLTQFEDDHIYNATGSAKSDVQDSGATNGQGAASRVNTLNHFEVKHPICSGDSHDFCLNPASAATVGFRLEYLDAQANGDFGGSHFYPGISNSAEADIVIANCSIGDYSVFLPAIKR